MYVDQFGERPDGQDIPCLRWVLNRFEVASIEVIFGAIESTDIARRDDEQAVMVVAVFIEAKLLGISIEHSTASQRVNGR
jgi:hypothetical protein